ncbi:MAG: 3'-5' exonuclease [Burkholderiales bacterium]
MRLFAKTRAVNLSTIHAAKGHEWPVVIVAGLVDGSLPISYAHTQSLVEEERRALYTAITRPSRRLTLISGPAVVARQTFRKPSQFLNSLSTWVRRT